jgi:hypothetical protein
MVLVYKSWDATKTLWVGYGALSIIAVFDQVNVDTKMDLLVRSVTVQRADRSVLNRPVHKLIRLLLD